MTPREFVKQTMQRIRELTEDMSDEEYGNCLEQLSFEIEAELEWLNWQLLTSEGKFV